MAKSTPRLASTERARTRTGEAKAEADLVAPRRVAKTRPKPTDAAARAPSRRFIGPPTPQPCAYTSMEHGRAGGERASFHSHYHARLGTRPPTRASSRTVRCSGSWAASRAGTPASKPREARAEGGRPLAPRVFSVVPGERTASAPSLTTGSRGCRPSRPSDSHLLDCTRRGASPSSPASLAPYLVSPDAHPPLTLRRAEPPAVPAATPTPALPPAPLFALVTVVGCRHCLRAKTALADAGWAVSELDLDANPRALSAVKAATGRTTVPQVFFCGELLGGADETVAALADGSLARRVEAAEAAEGGPPAALPPAVAEAVAGFAADASASASTANEMPRALAAAPVLTSAHLSSPLPAERERASLLAKATLRGRCGLPGCPVQDRKFGGGLGARRCFYASEAAAYLDAQLPTVRDASGGAAACLADLAAAGHLHVVASATSPRSSGHPRGSPKKGQPGEEDLLRFREDLDPPRLGEPLNQAYVYAAAARPAVEVSTDLRRRVLGLYAQFLSPDGRHVSYTAMASSPDFVEPVETPAELQARSSSPPPPLPHASPAHPPRPPTPPPWGPQLAPGARRRRLAPRE